MERKKIEAFKQEQTLKLKNNKFVRLLRKKYLEKQRRDSVRQPRLSFLGGAGTVTGSKYLLEFGKDKILIDCGLFQGLKNLRMKNREAFPLVNPKDITAIVLTHAHLDHSGYIPLIIKLGFKGKVYSSKATYDLCSLLLPDSGFLQEEDARYARRQGFSKHDKPEPLYTQKDAVQALKSFSVVDFGSEITIGESFKVTLNRSGHILGASSVLIKVGKRTILFSGDLGRTNNKILNNPVKISAADYVITESTYGNRVHDETMDPQKELVKIINKTVQRGGNVIIPAFAVGRAQELLYHLYRLKVEHKIPDIPVFLDSPMSIQVTKLLYEYRNEHRLSRQECLNIYNNTRFTVTVDQSKKIFEYKYPAVIISASGMATGGRILHHIAHYGPDFKNTILFAGFQAEGTRGRQIIDGQKEIKIHGQVISIKAEIAQLHNISAHADSNEIVAWLRNIRKEPKTVFVTHGESNASEALKNKIIKELGWHSIILPIYLQTEKL